MSRSSNVMLCQRTWARHRSISSACRHGSMNVPKPTVTSEAVTLAKPEDLDRLFRWTGSISCANLQLPWTAGANLVVSYSDQNGIQPNCMWLSRSGQSRFAIDQGSKG